MNLFYSLLDLCVLKLMTLNKKYLFEKPVVEGVSIAVTIFMISSNENH